MIESVILFAFLSAISIGIGTVFQAEGAKIINPITLVMYATLITALFLYIIIKFSKNKIGIKEMLKNYKKEILTIILLRIVLGSILLSIGLKYTSAVKALVLLRLEPVFIILYGYFLLKEAITKNSFFF